MQKFAEGVETLRKEIVATKEGGAITGEERLREQLDHAYGALNSYEGRPGDYQIERVKVLEQELKDVEDRTNTLIQRDLPKLNDALRGHGIEEITVAAAEVEGARAAALSALESGGNEAQWRPCARSGIDRSRGSEAARSRRSPLPHALVPAEQRGQFGVLQRLHALDERHVVQAAIVRVLGDVVHADPLLEGRAAMSAAMRGGCVWRQLPEREPRGILRLHGVAHGVAREQHVELGAGAAHGAQSDPYQPCRPALRW